LVANFHFTRMRLKVAVIGKGVLFATSVLPPPDAKWNGKNESEPLNVTPPKSAPVQYTLTFGSARFVYSEQKSPFDEAGLIVHSVVHDSKQWNEPSPGSVISKSLATSTAVSAMLIVAPRSLLRFGPTRKRVFISLPAPGAVERCHRCLFINRS